MSAELLILAACRCAAHSYTPCNIEYVSVIAQADHVWYMEHDCGHYKRLIDCLIDWLVG